MLNFLLTMHELRLLEACEILRLFGKLSICRGQGREEQRLRHVAGKGSPKMNAAQKTARMKRFNFASASFPPPQKHTKHTVQLMGEGIDGGKERGVAWELARVANRKD